MPDSNDRPNLVNADPAVQLAALAERVHALSNKLQEQGLVMRELSVSLKTITQENHRALSDMSERFLQAIQKQGERHERELSSIHEKLAEMPSLYVQREDISSQWRVIQAIAQTVAWFGAFATPIVFLWFYRWREGNTP